MTWPAKSLLISAVANTFFLAAAWFWFIWPLMPGLASAFKICKVFDPGEQPHAAACSGWHGTVAASVGVFLNVGFYWVAVWASGALAMKFTRAKRTNLP
jgi:hypothetical protein